VAFARAELWSAVHIGIAIVCACLPTLRPLLTRATATASSISRRLYGFSFSNRTDKTAGGSTSASKSGGVSHVEELPLESVNRANGSNDPYGDTTILTRNGESRDRAP